MKHYLLLLLTVLMLGALESEAKKKPLGNGIFWEISRDKELIISGNGPIPNYTSITEKGPKAPWFKKLYKKVRKIVIEEGITEIGDYAFITYMLDKPKHVDLPSTLKRIGEGAFEDANIRHINFPPIPFDLISGDANIEESINSLIKEYEKDPDVLGVFNENKDFYLNYYRIHLIDALGSTVSPLENCELRSVTIPDTWDRIPGGLFCGCRKLSDVSLPVNLIRIGSHAFSFCGALEEIDIPITVESIGQGAFMHSGLKRIHMHEGIKEIEMFAFDGCPIEEITLPQNAKIDEHAFGDFLREERMANATKHNSTPKATATQPTTTVGGAFVNQSMNNMFSGYWDNVAKEEKQRQNTIDAVAKDVWANPEKYQGTTVQGSVSESNSTGNGTVVSSRSTSGSSGHQCRLCNGTGRKISLIHPADASKTKWCNECKKNVGTGHFHTRCDLCGGDGWVD